jgi:hypothetical protein
MSATRRRRARFELTRRRAKSAAIVCLIIVAASLASRPASATVSLGAWIQHSPDDISGFTTLTGNDATATPTMPFSVTIEGVSYSTVTISTNGWLEFGGNTQGTSHPANVCLPTATHTNPFLAAYWDDLNPFGSIIRYGSVGTSPHRTYVVDYEVDLTSGSEGSDDLRFQVQVHEGSNLITVRYRDQQSQTNGIAATIGFQGAGGASGNAQPLTCNGKVLDDNRSDEGWSVDASRAGQVVLSALMAHSPDDISGFTPLSGDNAIAGVTLPAGFTVTIEGTSYSTLTIGTNGIIQFGTTTGANPTGNASLPSASFTGPTIFYYWDNLQTEGGNIRYGTVGTSPNRTFIVDFQENLVASPGDKVNGQVQIHERSNLINVKYRSTLSDPANGQSATIGFQGAGGASAEAYPLTFNGKILDDNRPDSGWSVHPRSLGAMSLQALIAHSPDDISGFTTLSGNNAIAGVTLPAGFSVDIDGTSYTTLTIGSNGIIQFGTTTGANPTANASLPSASFPNPTLFYYWDDLQTEGGHIRYGTVGTSPHRTFIVDFQENLVLSPGDKVNGQVQIHEGSNVFNVQYRSTMSANANGQSATIGFQGTGGGSATAYPLTFNGKILDDNLPNAGWSVAPLPICGNGITETQEDCDDGGANGTLASCCSSTCAFKANGTACTDDGNVCTDDQCNGASAICQHPSNTAPCSDSLFCNGTDTCSGGSCTVHTGDPCPGADADGDCAESCDEAADNCLAADPDGSACAGNGAGECSLADTCQAGLCQNNDVAAGTDCTDASPPSSGNCNDAQCNGTGTCDQNFANEVNGTSCNDGSFCNGTDTCNGGTCSAHTGDPCPGPDGDGNCAESCDEGADDCAAADPNGSPCSGNGTGECSNADTCAGGTCDNNDVVSGTPCTDTAPPSSGDCKVAQCDGSGTCDQTLANETDGTACDDSLFCNGTDTCASGTCSTHGGDPCPGADGDANCAETCDETADNCLGNDLDGSACAGNGSGECSAADTCLTGVCEDNDVASGTACTDTAPPASGNCLAAQCDGSGSCDQGFANETDGTGCDNGLFCDGTETCSAGACINSTGDPCPGPDTDTDCAESCDETADNCLAADPDGTTCRPDTGECDVPETCLVGLCPPDTFELPTTPCGSAVNTDCTNPDTCDGLGTCQANDEIGGFACGDSSDTTCTNPDTCDGAGACLDNHEPNTVVCRAVTTGGSCDEAENCDGAGNCPADGFQPSSTECRADTGDCDVAENCTGASAFCPADGFEASGTTCGDPTATDCDNADTCDGNNNCLDNLVSSGSACGDPTNTDCDNSDTCDGTGTCLDNLASSGAACGDGSNTTCTDPDTCDGSGACLANHASNGTLCDDGTSCTISDACTAGMCVGVSVNCPLDHYKCYQGKDLKNPKFDKVVGVETDDQMVTGQLVDAKKLKFVCTPVDKNGEGINDPNAHLACYQLKAPKFAIRPTVEVSTQFQTSRFEIKKGKLLCLPASKTVLP